MILFMTTIWGVKPQIVGYSCNCIKSQNPSNLYYLGEYALVFNN